MDNSQNTDIIIAMNTIILVLTILVSMVMAGPTIYKIDQEKDTAESLMIPVSSTGVCNSEVT